MIYSMFQISLNLVQMLKSMQYIPAPSPIECRTFREKQKVTLFFPETLCIDKDLYGVLELFELQ